jgi:surfeit locus 1 family protein
MVYLSDAGYHVITPLHVEATDLYVLVNRGWIPLGLDRSVLPQIDTPDEIVEIRGIADSFSKRAFTLGDSEPIKDAWPKRWANMDAERFSKAAGYSLLPFVILQDKDSPHGFERHWDFKFFKSKAIINLGYAIQWFAFAVVMLVIFVVVSTRTSRQNKSEN